MTRLHFQYIDELTKFSGQLEPSILDQLDPLEPMSREVAIARKLIQEGEMGTQLLKGIDYPIARQLLGAPEDRLPGMNATYSSRDGSPQPLTLFWHQQVLVIHLLRQAFQTSNETPCSGVICTDDVGLGKTASFLVFINQIAIELTHQNETRPEPEEGATKDSTESTEKSDAAVAPDTTEQVRVLPLLSE